MASEHDHTRRILLKALAGLGLTSIDLPHAATASEKVGKESRILTAFFSRTGNTRVIAGVIHRSMNTSLFEIEPASPYPEDYFRTVEQAKTEREMGTRPPLKNSVHNMQQFQTIYLGFPIWGTTIPPVVQTFLITHDFSRKLIIPFITHGGYGAGDTSEYLTRLTPGAEIESPLVIECAQERRTTEKVVSWLESVHN